MNEIEKATKYLKKTGRGYFIALYQYGDGGGVQYRHHGNPESLLGMFAAMADSIMNEYVPAFGREAVIESLKGTLENTIKLNEAEENEIR